MADNYPNMQIRGIDLFPIQPTQVPLNCRFRVDDLDPEWKRWDFGDCFDFIHARALNGSLRNWSKFYNDCYRCMNPDGWIEIGDHDFTIRSETEVADSNVDLWNSHMIDAATAVGRQICKAEDHTRGLQNAGFINIRQYRVRIPIGR